jgi:hypothetical protein
MRNPKMFTHEDVVLDKERSELVTMLSFYSEAYKYRDTLMVQEFYFIAILSVTAIGFTVKFSGGFGAAIMALVVAFVIMVLRQHMVNIDEDRKAALEGCHAILEALKYPNPHRGRVDARSHSKTPKGLMFSMLNYAAFARNVMYAASLITLIQWAISL